MFALRRLISYPVFIDAYLDQDDVRLGRSFSTEFAGTTILCTTPFSESASIDRMIPE